MKLDNNFDVIHGTYISHTLQSDYLPDLDSKYVWIANYMHLIIVYVDMYVVYKAIPFLQILVN